MDAKQIVKQYWPWLLGGAIGLYLLTRNSGSSSGGTVVMGYSDAAYAAQAQMAAVNAQAQLASEAANREHQLNLATLEAQTKTAYDANMAAYVAAQGQAAQGVAAAASGVIGALVAPGIAAMQASAYENAAALDAAAKAASAGYTAQADIVKNALAAAGQVGSSFMPTATAAQQNKVTPGQLAQDTFNSAFYTLQTKRLTGRL